MTGCRILISDDASDPFGMWLVSPDGEVGTVSMQNIDAVDEIRLAGFPAVGSALIHHLETHGADPRVLRDWKACVRGDGASNGWVQICRREYKPALDAESFRDRRHPKSGVTRD